MNVLVTGANGVVGKKLVQELESRGHSVDKLDNKENSIENYYEIDVGHYSELHRIFEKNTYDYVYHLAASFGRKRGEDRYDNLWKSNAVGTKNIIRLQEKYRFKLIFASSSEVYGDYSSTMFEDVLDKYPIVQANDYAMSKWVNEMQIKNSITQFNTKTVIFRLFNLYGEEPYSEYRSVLCKFIWKTLHNEPYTVYLDYYRTSCYITDAVKTLANIMNNFKSGTVYNIGGDEKHDIKTISDMILNYLGRDDSMVSYEDFDILTTKDKTVDCTKAKIDLGHAPIIKLKEGVPLTIEWMKGYYNL